MTYNTGNNLGSTDPRDLSDNSENLDRAVNNAASATWTDRFGKSRTSLAGQIGYIGTGTNGAIENYASGQVLSTYNTIIRYNSEFYRPSASAILPYTTTATLPDVDANLVAIGDANLRQDLASNVAGSGSDDVAHTGTTDTVTEALDKRTIYVGSVAELEPLSLPVGTNVYLTEEGRAGNFVIQPGIVPTDPQKGIYISLANGNYAERQHRGSVNVEWFGAVGDGSTNNSPAFQGAIDYLATIEVSATSAGSATFIGASAELWIPVGIYRLNTVVDASAVASLVLRGGGKAAIVGNTDLTKGNDFIQSSLLRYLNVYNLHFQNFNTVFEADTNNLDISNWDFIDCQADGINLFVNSRSYVDSRSTIVTFKNCLFQYGVVQICKLYCDAVSFYDCWIGTGNNSTDSIYVNSKLTIDGCVFIPAGSPQTGRSFVKLTNDNGANGIQNDAHRSVYISNSRISNEGGNCPLVVGDYPLKNINSGLSPDINIENCTISGYSGAPYEVGNSESGIVYLLQYPNAVSFKNCSFNALGAPNAQLVAKSDSLLNSSAPKTFNVYMDDASFDAAARAVGEVSQYTMAVSMREFINNPSSYIFKGLIENGYLGVESASTAGVKKSTFTINTGSGDATYASPIVFMLILGGAGDSSFDSLNYQGSSVYIATISAANTGSNIHKINFDKLHGNVFGASNAANCDIVSMHFGEAETGSITAPYSDSQKITIVFGNRVNRGMARIAPLHSKYNQFAPYPS